MSISKSKFFPLPLKGQYLGGGRWQLIAPFEYNSKKYGIFKIPIFFISDGASIPKLFYSLIGGPWTGKYTRAALPHDYLYATQTRLRSEADSIFLEAMKVLGVGWLRRKAMYLAVRSFGIFPWNKQKKKLSKLNT